MPTQFGSLLAAGTKRSLVYNHPEVDRIRIVYKICIMVLSKIRCYLPQKCIMALSKIIFYLLQEYLVVL